ncbi:MAG TPA: hypothetical protein VH720_02315 [Candidatus Limnocylindrales bacterium]|jgi:sugar/nucleoside kinase (ribokinase family)
MIAVVGNPILRRASEPAGNPDLAGTAALAAAAAVRAGAEVQLVGRAGDDPDGDAVVLALAGAGVGHAAVLRARVRTPVIEPVPDAGVSDDEREPEVADTPPDPGLEPADVDLALRYLPDFRVVVVAPDVPSDVAEVADRAASWARATCIRLVWDAQPPRVPGGGPDRSIVLGAPPTDPDGVFASLVGVLAAAIDRGEDPGTAFRNVVAASGWRNAAAE